MKLLDGRHDLIDGVLALAKVESWDQGIVPRMAWIVNDRSRSGLEC